MASPNGDTAECKCPDKCPNLGDHIGSRPVCGSDGLDYKDTCELRKAACLSSTEITVKYQGKCGKCVLMITGGAGAEKFKLWSGGSEKNVSTGLRLLKKA